MAKRKVTKEDLINYPELKENQIKEGEEYNFPDDETGNDDFENGDDTGGSAPPPNKGRG